MAVGGGLKVQRLAGEMADRSCSAQMITCERDESVSQRGPVDRDSPPGVDRRDHQAAGLPRVRAALDEALRLNESLATAYDLKEDLRQIWEQPTKHLGELALERWIRMPETTGIRQLIKFAQTLRKHRHGIPAWYAHPIRTRPPEGTSNKIKLLQRQAFGYRDEEFFKLRLLGLHQSKHALVG